MREVERNSEAGDAIRRKPFFRKPDMGPEGQAPGVQFPVKFFNPLLEVRPLDLKREIAQPQIQQLPVGHAIQSKGHKSIVYGRANEKSRRSATLTRRFAAPSPNRERESLQDYPSPSGRGCREAA